jgi:hypothetical protein
MSAAISRLRLAGALALAALAPAARLAHAGSGPENALVIIDPGLPESLYLGHRYVAARGIPARNVLYLRPDAETFAKLVDFQGRVVTGTLEARGIVDHIDQVILAPTRQFYVPAVGLVTVPKSGCPVPVNRFAISMAYGLLPQAPEILAGAYQNAGDFDGGSHSGNPYYGGRFRGRASALAFDAGQGWRDGSPDEGGSRLLLGSLLGWTGERGNTVAEIDALIDRSLRADGTRPEGSFYFMNTPDQTRSRGRLNNDWAATIRSLEAMGGKGAVLQGVLPDSCTDAGGAVVGCHDALGVLTGIAGMDAVGANFSLLPGAFADHLTSFAATYDEGGQTKMSQWISKGASGTLGTVEEPCTGGKFPVPDLHAHYYAGLSLGEAAYRALPWLAFESLLVGDPLTTPFAHAPKLVLEGLPQGAPVRGSLGLQAVASAGLEGGLMKRFELYVDGQRLLRRDADAGGEAGEGRASLSLDSARLADGWHQLAVVAIDDQAAAPRARAQAAIEVRNRGRWLTTEVSPAEGDPNTVFSVKVTAGGPDLPRELRLWQNDRLVAAAAGSATTLAVRGSVLGPGPSQLRLEADYLDNGQALSRLLPVSVALIDPPGVPPAGAPTAPDHSLVVAPGASQLLDLPAFFPDGQRARVEIVQGPEQAKLVTQDGAVRIDADYFASGLDSLRYRALDAEGKPGAEATVRLRYCLPGGDPREDALRVCPGNHKAWLPAVTR